MTDNKAESAIPDPNEFRHYSPYSYLEDYSPRKPLIPTPSYPGVIGQLVDWNLTHDVFPMIHPSSGPLDWHRLQLEFWLWQRRNLLKWPVLDIGAEWDRTAHRPDLPPFIRVNVATYETHYGTIQTPTVAGDVERLPFASSSIGSIIATEVFEHVADITSGVAECCRVLRPGGMLFATTPFFWPEHSTNNFADYWRPTPNAWKWLCRGFERIKVDASWPDNVSMDHLSDVAEREAFGPDTVMRLPLGLMVLAQK